MDDDLESSRGGIPTPGPKESPPGMKVADKIGLSFKGGGGGTDSVPG